MPRINAQFHFKLCYTASSSHYAASDSYVLFLPAINNHSLNEFFYDYKKFQCIPKYLVVLKNAFFIFADKLARFLDTMERFGFVAKFKGGVIHVKGDSLDMYQFLLPTLIGMEDIFCV